MASSVKITNANGKIVTIENNDNNMSDITLNGASITKKVDTLANMRAMNELPETLWCSGYHSKNDGAFGSHFYRLKGLKTTETDNGGTVIIVSVGGSDYVYELQYDGAVNVKWFGAVGDGVTDDTAAIQKCFDMSGKNSKVLYPSGIFIQDKIKVGVYTSIAGASMSSTKILSIASDFAFELNHNAIFGTYPSSSGDTFGGATYEKFWLEKQNKDKIGVGIFAKHCIRTSFRDIKVSYFSIGIDLSLACWSSTIDRCWVYKNTYGIYLGVKDDDGLEPGDAGFNIVTAGGFNGGTIRGCEIQGNEVGIYFKNYPSANLSITTQVSDKVSIRDNIIEGNSKHAIVLSGRQAATLIDGNYFEANSTDDSLIDPTSIAFTTSTDLEALIGTIVVNQESTQASFIATNNIQLVDSHYLIVMDYGTVTLRSNTASKGIYSRQPIANYAESAFYTSGNVMGTILNIDRALVVVSDELYDNNKAISYEGSWSAGVTGTRLSRVNNIVTISGSFTGGALANGNIFTLPETFRPRVRVEDTIRSMFKGSMHNIRIGTDGTVFYIHTEYIGNQRNNTTDTYFVNVSFEVEITKVSKLS